MSTPKKKPVEESSVENMEEIKAAPEETGENQPALSMEAILAMVQDAVKHAVADTKAESDAKIAALKEELAEAKKEAALAKSAPAYSPMNGDVTLVYLSDAPGIINKVPGIVLNCGYYGEEFTLSRHQFDAIVGVYRKWFDMGILAVSRDNIDVAAKKGLKTQDEYYLKPGTLQSIGTMPVESLKKLWNDCKNDNERLSIVSYYKRKFIEGKEPGFHETERVLAMNTLTKQGLKREALEISGASLKITPTDFLS